MHRASAPCSPVPARRSLPPVPVLPPFTPALAVPDPWTLDPDPCLCYTIRASALWQESHGIAKIIYKLFTEPAERGAFPVLLPTPCARDFPTCGLLPPSSSSCVSAFLAYYARTRLLSPFTPAPSPPAVPTPDSRSSIPERMGFPPGSFFAPTHGVSSCLGRPCSLPPCLRDRSARFAPRSHARPPPAGSHPPRPSPTPDSPIRIARGLCAFVPTIRAPHPHHALASGISLRPGRWPFRLVDSSPRRLLGLLDMQTCVPIMRGGGSP
jgi:hypothetical protein